MPISQTFLGRGLDHPWFDRNKLSQHPVGKSGPLLRSGAVWFFRENFRENPDFGGPDREKLFSLFAKSHVCVTSFVTVLRDYLPPTDFSGG
jgi:hypothetical protein